MRMWSGYNKQREMYGDRPNSTLLRPHAEIWEMCIEWVVKRVDILIMILLYFSGTIGIDCFHILVLVIFALFILYPQVVRKQFFYCFLLILFFMCSKYVYSLLIYELALDEPEEREKGIRIFNEVLRVLGMASTGWD